MAYCHECGSEVAENDAFCPFCGITLQPIIVENDEDDALSSTIMIPHPVKPGVIAKQTPADSLSDKTDAIKKIETVAENESKTGDYSNSVTSEDVEFKTESVEIPAEENLQTKSEKDITSEPQTESQKPFVGLSENEIEKSIGNTAESSLMPYEEAEIKKIKEIPSAEEPETTSGEDEPEAAEADFTATIPYIPSGLTKKVSVKDKVENAVLNEDKSTLPTAEDKNPPIMEEAVAKPDEELPEISCPPPRFDSVRIMEEDKKPELVEKKSEQSAAAKLQKEPPLEDLSQSSEQKRENRSYTTPNIGFGETDGKKSAKLKPLDEGTVLNDRYEIVRKIGGGGMGAVYLASDKNLGGVLRAVKEMVQSYIEGEQQEKAINDFKRESLLLSTLDHSSIPTIYDYFFDEKEGRFYLVMKYISGGDLAARIRSAPEGRIDENDVTEWAIQVADVLDYLHNRQIPIVYRDLKPANIMIDGNSGRVMLIDFGIARFINKEEKGVTAVGTMGYAPPELFSGNVEPRSDIYSLGSTLFHLLTGADPQSNPLLIFDFQKHPRPRQINPQLSDQMEKILMRAVEYNANQRFTSAAELREVLEEHLKNLKANKVTFGIKETTAPAALSDQSVFCGFCGQKIVATDMFCAFCGAKQPLARQGVHGADFVPQPLTARLLIIGTNELETPAYRIEKDDNLLGRRDPMSNIFPEVDLSKFDPQTKISRRHARIWRDGSQFMVEDLGSSNGTVVLPMVTETVRLMPYKPYALTNGDKLKLGDTTLHFIIG
ncbi:MAG: protein kinase domain-containing protein [Pyrinomonadaceae bacterium]